MPTTAHPALAACPVVPRLRLAHAVAVFVVLRGILAGGLVWWEVRDPTPINPKLDHYHGVAPRTDLPGQLCIKWDSYWYLDIARNGYRAPTDPRQQSNVAFAPLYPALIAALSATGVDPGWSGIAISLACLAGLLSALYVLGCALGGTRTACMAVAWLAVVPGSWVLNMVYSEALFALLIAGLLLARQRGWRKTAAGCAALLPLTRFAGLVILPAIALEGLIDSWRQRRVTADWLLLGAASAGAAALYAIYHLTTGDGMIFVTAKHAWSSYRGLYDLFPPMLWAFVDRMGDDVLTPLYAVIALGYVAVLVLLLRTRRDAGTWFVLGCCALYLGAPDPSGVPRFMLPLIPLHVAVANWLASRPRLAFALTLSTLLLTMVLTRAQLVWRAII